jgi:AcrR family transcriptional regulator
VSDARNRGLRTRSDGAARVAASAPAPPPGRGRRCDCAQGRRRRDTAEIAEGADVGSGSFYNYFAGKEDLLDAVIDDALELHGQAVDALTADEPDPAAVIATALYATLSLIWNDPVWARLLVGVAVTHESLLRRPASGSCRTCAAGSTSAASA